LTRHLSEWFAHEVEIVAQVVPAIEKARMKYGYAQASTDGQSVAAQVKALRAAGAKIVF
jgi:hypothetical protein